MRALFAFPLASSRHRDESEAKEDADAIGDAVALQQQQQQQQLDGARTNRHLTSSVHAERLWTPQQQEQAMGITQYDDVRRCLQQVDATDPLFGHHDVILPPGFSLNRLSILTRRLVKHDAFPEVKAKLKQMDENHRSGSLSTPEINRKRKLSHNHSSDASVAPPSGSKKAHRHGHAQLRAESHATDSTHDNHVNTVDNRQKQTQCQQQQVQQQEQPYEQGDEDEDEEEEEEVLMTRKKLASKSVEKYSELIERLISNSSQREQESHFEEHQMDLFSRDEMETLMQTLRIIIRKRILCEIDVNLLITLMEKLNRQAQRGLAIDVLAVSTLDRGDEEWKASGSGSRLVARVQCALESAICILIIMSTPDIDRRLIAEESIDICSELFKHVAQRYVIPVLDPTSTNGIALRSQQTRESPNGFQTPTKTHGDKSRATPPSARSHSRTPLSKYMHKSIDKLIPVVCDFMEWLANLILQVKKLADRWILMFSSSMISMFSLEFSSQAILLQQKSLTVLRSIVINYKTHRSLLMSEALSVMVNLPLAKKTLRMFRLFNSDETVQMISVLIVSMIQACASSCECASISTGSELEEEMNADDVNQVILEQLKEAQESSAVFVGLLLKECMKKHDERDSRVVLDNFVDDLLVMFVRPEWCGAEIILEVLISSLVGILESSFSKGSRKLESAYSLTALSMVGKICVSIKSFQNLAKQEAIEHDTQVGVLMEEHISFMKSELMHQAHLEIDQEDVLKHLMVVYLIKNDDTVANLDDAKCVLLARLVDASKQQQSDSSERIQATLNSLWRMYWKGYSSKKIKAPPPDDDMALSLSIRLAVSRKLCGLFDALIANLMKLLSAGLPTFRARVMKALAGIVDVDPMLMADEIVRHAVSRCFLDEATSVRQAAVDLVGKYVSLQPLLFDRYFDVLVERLRDKGVSVRRSVCKIFRTFLTTVAESNGDAAETDLRRKVKCMRVMVERIGDPLEEQIVKNFIIDTFQEVWFGNDLSSAFTLGKPDGNEAPPGWKVVEKTLYDAMESPQEASTRKEFMSPDGKVCRSLDDAWTMHRTVAITPSSIVEKRSKMDDTSETACTIVAVVYSVSNLAWFVDLLKRLMLDDAADSSTKSGSTANRSKTRAEDRQAANARSQRIVSWLVEYLIRIEEGHLLKGLLIDDVQLQFLACMKTLHAFCEVNPALMTNHLENFMVYLQTDDKTSKSKETQVQSLVVQIIRLVLLRMPRVQPSVVDQLQKVLKSLIFQAPPSVVEPSVKCLAALSTSTKRPPVELLELLQIFYGFLTKHKARESLQTGDVQFKSSMQRALFTAGQIAGSMDLDVNLVPDNKLPKGALKQGQIMESLYEMYAIYLKKHGDTACTTKAVQGLGFMFPIRPRLLLRAEQDHILEMLLVKAPLEVRYQTVMSLKDLLKKEEQRLEKGLAKKAMNKKKSKKDQVQGDQEADASLIGSVMQARMKNLLALSFERQARVRSEVVACISVLLTQGLVSPLLCMPNLVALESDHVVSIRDAAHAQLVAANEKHPTFINTTAIKGIVLSYSFQLRAFGKCSVMVLDKDRKEYCVFGRLYTDCLRSSRKQRIMFLSSLVNKFDERNATLSDSSSSTSSTKTLDYWCYITQLLSALPYDIEDEPLLVIYLINRYTSLKLGGVINDLKKRFASFGIAPDLLSQEDVNYDQIDIKRYLKGMEDGKKIKSLESLHVSACVALAIALLLRLKFFLKDMYLLDNEKCQVYQPSQSIKMSDQPVMLSEPTPKLELPTMEELEAESPIEMCWNFFQLLLEATSRDQLEMDFEMTHDAANAKAKKRKGKRRKSATSSKQTKQVEDDDEEDELIEGFE